MSVRISKEFRFEMGHRLPYHSGGCQNVHGHSYRLHVSIIGKQDEGGMVLDYDTLGSVVRPIVKELDHAFMVDPSDTLMLNFLDESGLKAMHVPFYSTAENISRYLLERIQDELRVFPHLDRIIVRLQETERTYAEVEADF